MKKETFVKVIEYIKKEEEIEEQFTDALHLVCDGHSVFTGPGQLLSAIMLIFKDEFGKKEEYISWWIWEDVEKIIYDNDKKIDVSTPEKLYDFITRE